MKLNRRDFIKSTGAASLVLAMPNALTLGMTREIPVRAITKGPRFHWFGYYDKLQFSKDNSLVLGMQVDFESRSPTKDDVIKMGYVDLNDNDRWV